MLKNITVEIFKDVNDSWLPNTDVIICDSSPIDKFPTDVSKRLYSGRLWDIQDEEILKLNILCVEENFENAWYDGYDIIIYVGKEY